MASFVTQLQRVFSVGGPIQIGIDVGASAVKVVALRGGQGGSPKLVGLAVEETPMGCVIDGMLSDTRSMADVVKNALMRCGVSYKDESASVGLRGLNVVFKRLIVPFQQPEDMARQVLLDAQQQVDSDLGDWIIDYQILTAPDPQGQVAVMLVAAKRSSVEEFQGLLTLVGVKPNIFDCDVFAIGNSFEHSTGVVRESVLCLDIGRDTTKINVIQDGIPILVRSVPLGGAHLTEQISKAMGIDFEQAESMKISASQSPDVANQTQMASALKAHTDEICEEIQRTLDFFSNAASENKIEAIERVVLSGGGAAAPGLANAIGQYLKSQVSLADPFAKISVGPKFETQINGMRQVFSVAVGLALRYGGDKGS